MSLRFTRILLTLVAVMAFVLPTTGASQTSETVWEGDEVMRCRIVASVFHKNCDYTHLHQTIERLPALYVYETGDHPPSLSEGVRQRATLVIEWVPVSPDTQQLQLYIMSDYDCEDTTTHPTCFERYAKGESPLVVEFEGPIAGGNITAWLQLIDPCYERYPACTTVPVRVALNQTYHWRWTTE